MQTICSNSKIHTLFQTHAKEMIVTLKEEGIHFSIAALTSLLDFNPPLNYELYERVGRVGVFVLSGYSFESLEIDQGFFEFEAGLSTNNREDVGTIIKVPYTAILQILIQDEMTSKPIPIFINPFEVEEESSLQDSIQAILSKNLHLIRH